ncbi:hypothetical protein SCP_0307070 [Sparassis crispa]|uniref:DUF1746 domain-containing protein n=1 Tax=Sparassis crispa TaxID=139825 RepID=A0A401GFL3_9APHY|nr:hypothetical protein SCP_0307070 [Sparassis crispa]GBE80984.1 hypothetical protein SCP_0307070 [Sparassis crispa]
MPIHHAQRQHIIYSLDALVYQLHTLSFLLSPSIWAYLCRVSSQFQFSRPRTLDSSRTLRFWYLVIVFFNIGSVWSHAAQGAAHGRSVILDFVGLAYTPSKAHLLFLDFLIIFLNMLLVTIAFETSLSSAMPPNTPDPLLPSITTSPMPLLEETPKNVDTPYVINIRLSTLFYRLRYPPPPPPPHDSSTEDLLPLPITTSWQTRSALGLLSRARQARTQIRDAAIARARPADTEAGSSTVEENVRTPGGIDTDSGT